MLNVGGASPDEILKVKQKASEFLKKYKMFFSDIDKVKYIGYFIDEMEKGLCGKDSSLKMLPTFIDFSDISKINFNQSVIVLDAGGTNLRSALVKFSKNYKAEITNLSKYLMPGVKREVSKDVFFDKIVSSLKKIINQSDKIGFVFSYPIEIFKNKDGKLIKFTKEIKAPEVEGEFIGKNLIITLGKKNYCNKKKVVLLNDTVASLLSGIIAYPKRYYETYVGFVLGTGMNVSYFEKNSNIEKLKDIDTGSEINKQVKLKKLSDKSRKNLVDFNWESKQIINVEAGNFSRGPIGIIDEIFDKKTLNPGHARYEKMFSGAYFGNLALEVLKKAADDNILSKNAAKIIYGLKELNSKEIDLFLAFPPINSIWSPYINLLTLQDILLIYFIFDFLIERAAVLAAIVLGSIIIKTQTGKNPCYPVCIVAEGSSFYKMKNFNYRVNAHLKDIFKSCSLCNYEYYYEINKVENAILLGGAAAGLMA